MIFKNRIWAAVIILGALALAIFLFVKKDGSDDEPNGPQPEINFKQEGNVTMNNPGFKPDTWYLIYDQPGSPAVTKELDLNNQTNRLRSGQRVYIEGRETNNVVKVSTLQIRNAYKDDLIWVQEPLPDALITSPLTITGEARGNWYFEASFPVKLLDANGTMLAQIPAQAQGEWMTTEYVPFEAQLIFNTAPTTDTGVLVLEKDNPSGLPENADELRMPVRFNAAQRGVKLFYYDPNKDKDASGNIMCSRNGLVAIERQVPITNTPIQDTIKLLLQGQLTTEEKSQGVTTEYPLPGFELRGADLKNGQLTLEFTDPQNRSGGGSCRVGILWFQIEATAKQFSGVNEVRFIPEELFQP